jgi:hypothetical protein
MENISCGLAPLHLPFQTSHDACLPSRPFPTPHDLDSGAWLTKSITGNARHCDLGMSNRPKVNGSPSQSFSF